MILWVDSDMYWKKNARNSWKELQSSLGDAWWGPRLSHLALESVLSNLSCHLKDLKWQYCWENCSGHWCVPDSVNGLTSGSLHSHKKKRSIISVPVFLIDLSTIVAEFHPIKCCDSRTHDLAAVTILYKSAWAPTEFSILDFNLAAGAASLPVDLLRKNQLILITMLLCVSTKKTIQSCKTLNILFLYAVKWSCSL